MKKFFAVLLSVLMVCGCMAVGASAEDAMHYVVLGDSIAYGSGITNPEQACYGKIVADTNGYTYANHAVPGHTTANLISRLSEKAVLDDVKKADIINISIGGNNFLMGDIVSLISDALITKDFSDFDAIAKEFYEQLCRIMDIINKHNPDAVVLLQTIYNPQNRTPWRCLSAGSRQNQRRNRALCAEFPG